VGLPVGQERSRPRDEWAKALDRFGGAVAPAARGRAARWLGALADDRPFVQSIRAILRRRAKSRGAMVEATFGAVEVLVREIYDFVAGELAPERDAPTPLNLADPTNLLAWALAGRAAEFLDRRALAWA